MSSGEDRIEILKRRFRFRMFNRMVLGLELASDEVVGWRSLGALFLIGAFLAVAAIPLWLAGGYRSLIVAVIALIAAITGLALCRYALSLPLGLMSPVLGFGTLLITLVVIASGQSNGRYSLFYVWVALQAFYFLRPRVAALHLVSVGAGYALALIVLEGGADQWLLVLGVVVTTGGLIGVLRARIERLSTQARTDPLTGLANRRGFDENVELALERARASHQPLSLTVIDLDGLKVVNDRHGHLEGDAVLRRFAHICSETIALPVARLGGDEFAIIGADLDHRGATELASRIQHVVRTDSELSQRGVTISIGIATSPADGDSARSLLQAADRALYYVKNLGGDQLASYGQEIERRRKGDARGRTDRNGNLDALILLGETLDLRDISTSAHSRRVARYAELIAKELGLDERRRARIRLGGLLHDVGKIGVPEDVLLKPGSLTADEWQQIERHPEIGAQILETAGLTDIASWVAAHHERPDGNGYPLRLSGDAVPLEARILAVADAYEAMTSDRPYRDAIPAQTASEELRRHRGTQFDPAVVDVLLHVEQAAGESPRMPEVPLVRVAQR